MVLITADRGLTLQDLALLADRGMIPADRDPGLVLGRKQAIFATPVNKWIFGARLPAHLQGRLLQRFSMSGVYRTNFKVESRGYSGPLSLEITAPRDGFGRHLVASGSLVRPQAPSEMRVDSAGNRWFCVSYPQVQYGDVIKLYFSFTYHVDMAELLEHDVMLAGKTDNVALPERVRIFLEPGYKINPRMPQAYAWAVQGGQGPPDARREFRRLTEFLKRVVTYDKRKRREYFGGHSVYCDLDDMYRPAAETLSKGRGACPDTILIECAFLRARGIPCRTAGRFGHFFSLVYVPGQGWMSTSVTPTGIPLIISPGPDHVPYQKWEPRIALKTTRWEARVRIQAVED
jgi:hypothetical protein